MFIMEVLEWNKDHYWVLSQHKLVIARYEAKYNSVHDQYTGELKRICGVRVSLHLMDFLC